MTPQVLLDAMRNAFLRMEMFQLIIFDECHRTTGNHPYARIMKVFHLFSKGDVTSFAFIVNWK